MLPQSVDLPWPTLATHNLAVIGDMSLILRQDYDPRQTWLPFVHGLLVHEDLSPAPETPRRHMKSTAKFAEKGSASVPDAARDLYHYEENVPQPVLPFPGWRVVGRREFARIMTAGAPGWDRSPQGAVLAITFDRAQRTSLEEYCRLACAGRYLLRNQRAYFEREADWIMAKVGWAIKP